MNNAERSAEIRERCAAALSLIPSMVKHELSYSGELIIERSLQDNQYLLSEHDRLTAELEQKTRELERYRDALPFTLRFGTGKYIVADTYQADGNGVGVCVYPNPSPSPALGQTDVGSHGKSTDEVGAIVHLKFSNIDSIEVWIRALNKAKKTITEQEAALSAEGVE